MSYKLDIIEYGKKIVEMGLTSGTGGNLSCYDREKDLVYITPSGLAFDSLEEEDLVTIDLDGNVLEGKYPPSSEWIMHTEMYRHREDMNAIVHAHTVYSTVLSALRMPLEPAHYMVAVGGKRIEVADYATFGTKQLALNAVDKLGKNKAVLLANHGVIAGDGNMKNALNIIDQVEYSAKIYCLAKMMGEPVILDDQEMDVMLDKFSSYGKFKDK